MKEPLNILLVDDEVRNLDVLESLLANPDYRLVRARTPDEALLCLVKDEIACIVLDVQMPEMSGIELAKLIKTRKRTRHVPILFLTAYYHEDKDILQGYDAGAVDYLTKPVNPRILISKVSAFADLYRTSRALAEANAALEVEIAQRQKAEEELRQANLNLESKVSKRTEELSRANRELAESEARFRLMADHSALMIWMTEPDGACSYVNRTWCEFTGQTLEAARGAGWHQPIHADDQPRAREAFREATARREDFRHEYRLRTHDGVYRTVLDAAAPRFSPSGEFLGYVGSLMDVTEQREAEQKLKSARDEALAAARAKDDFLAALSHELRTPLNPALLLATDAAANNAWPREAREAFESIRKNIDLEARLIDDLLDLTRITRGMLHLELIPMDVHAVLKDALSALDTEIQSKRIHLNLNIGKRESVMLGDPVRMQQVFWNVLKNAIKFTGHDGKLSVRSRNVDQGSRLIVEIEDSGIGMTATELDRIFLAFSQGDHAQGAGGSHRFGGLGLGLAISIRLLELQSGKITASSPGPGKGSTFTIEVPLLSPDQRRKTLPQSGSGSKAPAAPALRDGQPIRVLLVEDHHATRTALRHVLARRNCHVTATGCMADARAAADRETFDLLICDIGLPDGSGYDLMRELNGRYRLNGIALTGYGMDRDVERSKDAGFMAHLIKPVRVEALDRILEEVSRPDG